MEKKDSKKRGNRIISVVIILTVILIGVYAVYSQSKEDKKSDNSLNPDDFVKESLEKQGYEVTDLGLLNDKDAFVKMKTFGKLEDQVRWALMALVVVYNTAEKYQVQISFSGKDCYYEINGAEYREYLSKLKSEENTDFVLQMDSKIGESEVCY